MKSTRYKYPRTLHLPWSPGASDDDKILESVEHFQGREVVVTEKLDGENTSMYQDHYHARSTDSKNHPSRNFVKQIWGRVRHDIPFGYRLCGENVYAVHSIKYTALPEYFMLFTVYDPTNLCLSWDETVEWAKLLDLPAVPVLYRGVWDEEKVRACWTGKSLFGGDQEGYVVRVADAFPWADHHMHFAKYVRAGHVTTDEHWMSQPVVPNQLA